MGSGNGKNVKNKEEIKGSKKVLSFDVYPTLFVKRKQFEALNDINNFSALPQQQQIPMQPQVVSGYSWQPTMQTTSKQVYPMTAPILSQGFGQVLPPQSHNVPYPSTFNNNPITNSQYSVYYENDVVNTPMQLRRAYEHKKQYSYPSKYGSQANSTNTINQIPYMHTINPQHNSLQNVLNLNPNYANNYQSVITTRQSNGFKANIRRLFKTHAQRITYWKTSKRPTRNDNTIEYYEEIIPLPNVLNTKSTNSNVIHVTRHKKMKKLKKFKFENQSSNNSKQTQTTSMVSQPAQTTTSVTIPTPTSSTRVAVSPSVQKAKSPIAKSQSASTNCSSQNEYTSAFTVINPSTNQLYRF